MGTIRLLLAISVVIAHSTPVFGQRLWGGEIAVELFFIISGFYMSLILSEKYNTPDKIVIFYKNRFLKLFPIYWTILILSISFFVIIYITFGKSDIVKNISNSLDNLNNLGIYSIYIFMSNIFLLGEDLLMFLGFNGDTIIFTKSFSDTKIPLHQFVIVPQSWTLSLEIMFYLIAPFIARKSIKLVIFLFSISVLIKLNLWITGYSNDPWSYRFILSELAFFFIGMIMYKVYKLGFYTKVIENKKLFFFGLISFILSGYFYYDFKTILDFNGIDTFKYMIYLLFVLFLPLLFVKTKSNKIDRYIGELSYPVYIVHIFSMYLISLLYSCFADNTYIVHISGSSIPFGENFALFSICLSILLSILLNKFIQKKVEKIRINNLKGND
ncbi:MAG: acyltransferase [Epsilonproteobacteria bacterium]|nr:acyltransferase [Campylobacterota bacterium]PIP10344.1 MAG: hypothetical protein COX50_06340 [Sulfurimonas sp. CG23_combo_of_CG06-09_8_20_14_all_36_33]PIS25363.1 MAG: hypothetical protein COT46_06210 [Sulfurimonas sp. CG08_land_8_20_14_0_20_36_33]PIU34537.1 MAG: hypothetical protein COT05_07210 [Sulfurimonas sp. CG07_land_8_20_14_0_80_36_56]PIV02830.1 MAG: hypothetical protein COS56_10615 [Sulfurimonas sp. CG03_land_8_20_14_0_80_36_25]PIV36084.1 MAG: hypothetical protein COS32_04085 [Sulfur